MSDIQTEIISHQSKDGEKFAVQIVRPIKRYKSGWFDWVLVGIDTTTNYGFFNKNGFAQMSYQDRDVPQWFNTKAEAEKLAELIKAKSWSVLEERPLGRYY
jgi:hypothetical protein